MIQTMIRFIFISFLFILMLGVIFIGDTKAECIKDARRYCQKEH